MKKSLLCAFLLAAVPALATISKVQSAATWNSSGSTCNVSLTGTTAGNLIVLWMTWSPSSLTLNLGYTDPAGNTYASAVGPTIQTASNTAAQIVYAKNLPNGGNDAIHFPFANSGSATSVSCVAVEYSGLDTMYPLDSVSAGYSNSVNPTGLLDSGTVAPANANLLVFGGGTSDTSYTVSAGSGFTSVQNNPGSITEQFINSPTSPNNTLQRATACLAIGMTCSPTTTGNWLMQMAVFRDASWTVAGGWPPARLGQILYASQFPGVDASAKIQNAIDACPLSGCTVSALDLSDVGGTGSQNIDPGSKAVSLLLGPYTYIINQITLRTAFSIVGSSDGMTTLQSPGSVANPNNNPVFVIPQGANNIPAQRVHLENFQAFGSVGNSTQDGLFADCSNTTYTGNGLEYSLIQNVAFQKFMGVSIHLRCNPNNATSNNQFLTFINVQAFRPSMGSHNLMIEGANGQIKFINSEFDGTPSGCPLMCAYDGTNIYVGTYMGGAQYPYSIDFDRLVSQAAQVAVNLNGVLHVAFRGSHHEHIATGGYLLTNGALNIVEIDNAYFANDGSYHNSMGTGYLINASSGAASNTIAFTNSIWGQFVGAGPDNLVVGSPSLTMCNNVGPANFGSGNGQQFYKECQFQGQSISATLLQANEGGAQTGAGIHLTGWGSAASVSSVTGTTQTEQFLISTGGTGYVSAPTVTVTFPNGFPLSPAPICTLDVVGITGSGGAIIFAPGTPSLSSATFTAYMNTGGTFTPAASETYNVVMRCGP